MDQKKLKDYIVSGITAGICISLALFVYLVVLFYTNNKLAASVSFSVGFLLCTFFGLDLYTSKCFVYTVDVLQKQKKPHTAFGLLFFIFLFNAIGAIAICGLYALAKPGIDIENLLAGYATTKAGLGIGTIFVRAILCNLFVCSATLFSIKLKDNPVARILLVIICIFPFVILGLEHSVANIGVYSLALLTGTKIGAVNITLSILFSVLGNLVGGILFALFCKLNKSKTLKFAN